MNEGEGCMNLFFGFGGKHSEAFRRMLLCGVDAAAFKSELS